MVIFWRGFLNNGRSTWLWLQTHFAIYFILIMRGLMYVRTKANIFLIDIMYSDICVALIQLFALIPWVKKLSLPSKIYAKIRLHENLHLKLLWFFSIFNCVHSYPNTYTVEREKKCKYNIGMYIHGKCSISSCIVKISKFVA